MAGEKQTEVEINKPIFRDLNADDSEPETTEIESLCVNCGENGITRLLLTKIPFYKDVIIMSFNCEHCGFQNNEIQSGRNIPEKGIKISLNIVSAKDLNRQVIKSDHTSVSIPHLEFEMPPSKSEITTIEGILDHISSKLLQDQPRRCEENPDIADKIDQFISKIQALKNVTEPFIITFEDITGNCHVENPNAPRKDSECTVKYFKRTEEQNHLLGIYSQNEDTLLKPIKEGEYPLEEIEGEVLSFRTNCPNCNSPCETNMKVIDIPHFKQVVIMATLCESCGHRTNEVKSGSGIEPHGIRIEVTVTGKEDFSRDILKSETCNMEIPELELEVGPAALGGRFTTVEGIIDATKEQLSSSTALIGDSSDENTVKRIENFIDELTEVLKGNRTITLVLDDPAGNSYVQSLLEDKPDDRLKITKYERSFEQNEELGLNDMKVENY